MSHGIFIHRLHRALLAAGHEVDVMQSGDWAPPWPVCELHGAWRAGRREQASFLDEVDGVRLHHPLVVHPRPSRFFGDDPWDRRSRALVAYARRRLARRRFDVVLAHFLVPDGYHALAVGRALGVPVVAMAWGDDVHAWPERSADWAARLRRVLREANGLVACSERMARDANAWLSGPRDDWRVVYGGVDLERFGIADDRESARRRVLPPVVADRISPDVHVALVLAQACVAKGYRELLESWARLSPSHVDWHLVMAGGATGDFDVAQELEHRGLAARAHWLGPQPPTRIPDLLHAADAFVLPSHNEGLSLSLLEAMASGLPSVATDVGGHAEVIRDESEGWLIPARDTDALTIALAQMMSDAAERRRRGANARRAAERIGTPEANAHRLVAALEHARTGHRVGRPGAETSAAARA